VLFIPLSIAILSATSQNDGPKASAFINLSQQLGGLVAVAALSAFLDQRQTVHADALRSTANLANVNVQQFLRAHNPLTELAGLVNGQGLILAYTDAVCDRGRRVLAPAARVPHAKGQTGGSEFRSGARRSAFAGAGTARGLSPSACFAGRMP
jgi:hypothetical protein